MKSISVFCHLYYKDSFPLLKPYLQNLSNYQTQYFFNLCSDTDYYHQVAESIKATFKGAVITCTPNVGKDIGGKLVLMDTYLKLKSNSDYMVFLHDKISPHTSMGETWRGKLLTILEEENIDKILTMYLQNEDVGLIANKNLIMNEYDSTTGEYTCTSNKELITLRKTFELQSNIHDFIGGTMFWARSSIYHDFFKKFKPLLIRKTLEKGNILDHQNGSLSHAWERAFSWIVLNKGYKIIGI